MTKYYFKVKKFNKIIMNTRIKYSTIEIIGFIILTMAFFAFSQMVQWTTAEAVVNNNPTYAVMLEKNISDNKLPNPYTADEFKFHIVGVSATGNPVDMTVQLDSYTDDTANKTVFLPIGNYTISEVGPDDFVPEDWTVQWSGYTCDGGNGPIRSSVLEVTDDETANTCRADNQWRPLVDPEPIFGCTDVEATNYDPEATDDDDTCEYDEDPGPDPQTGTLVVTKVVINNNGGTSTPNNFSFSLNGGSSVAFDADGTNVLNVATGTHSITEPSVGAGYTLQSNTCLNVVVLAGATTTCTITNNDVAGGNNGGGPRTGTLLVSKVIVGTTTVPTSTFSFTYSGTGVGTSTFDADGTNALNMATGTYSITEVAALGYTTTYSNCSGIVVSAGATSTPCVITNTLIDTPQVGVCSLGNNLLSNGGFEVPDVTNAAGWDIFASGTSGLQWIVSWAGAFVGAPVVANLELHGGVNGWLPSEGVQYAELDSDWAGPTSAQTGEEASSRIAQTLSTAIGATYELSFDFSPRPQTDATHNKLEVFIGGVLKDTLTSDGSANANTAWNDHSYTFVATATSTEIAFRDAGLANSEGTFIDNAAVCFKSNGGGGYSQGSYGGGNGYSQGSYGGGNGYSQGSYGGGNGNGRSISMRDGGNGGNDDDDDDNGNNGPRPRVLGDSTMAFPAGSPDTGRGGAAPLSSEIHTLSAIVATRKGVQVTNVK